MKLKNGTGPVIAQREFYIKGDRMNKIVLRIRGGDYEIYPCVVGGYDSLQALVRAILYLESRINDVKKNFL